jgi:hypothetical protein
LKKELLSFLVENQNSDGSWAYVRGKSGATEPTAYALMALLPHTAEKSALERGFNFLTKRQGSTGGWSVSTRDSEETAWVTALAGTSLLAFETSGQMCAAAARFVLASFAKNPRPWILRVADWMRSWDASYIEENLGGWKWNPETANWVEPTAYGLLFLKKFSAVQSSWKVGASVGDLERLHEIVRQAESLLYLRMCKDGGWNYGNARVLGEELRPYPLTTALALIALQNQADRPHYQKSLAYLTRATENERSGLALSLAVLCLSLNGFNTERHRNALASLYAETGFFRNIKAVALALLACETAQGGLNPFQLGAKRSAVTAATRTKSQS